MSWGSPIFVLAIIAMAMVTSIITTTVRAKHGYPISSRRRRSGGDVEPESDRKIELLSNENGELKDKIVRLEERISVLERIATDKGARLADEIENLRDTTQ